MSALTDVRTRCEHRSTLLVAVELSNGAPPQYKRICTDCGTRFNPIAHTKLSESEKTEALRNAESLSAEGGSGRQETARKATQVMRLRLSEDPRYLAYLESAGWKDRRSLVLLRSGWMCEGCGVRRARDVHHLSYAHLYDEFLFELVAVCRQCHERWHERMESAAPR